MSRAPLLTLSDSGLYCQRGDFHIDPWRPVRSAVVTHAHADHLRWGSDRYLVPRPAETVTRARLGPQPRVDFADYGQAVRVNGVTISFHPAGHILGSAQVRVEHRGEVWVVSGDYKVGGGDRTCAAFEPVRCHGFVTESTFGLPIYRWAEQAELFAELNTWWRANRDAGKASLVFCYALGKAQRVLAGIDPGIGPVYTHGAVERLTAAYRAAGVDLPPTQHAGVADAAGKRAKRDWAGALILAPPSAHGSAWARKFAPYSTALASGWMTIRGTRRRKAIDRGFALSDHADWPGLLWAIRESGAETVWVTHGYTAVLVRWLREQGLDASAVETRFEGEAGGEVDEELPAGGDEPGLPAGGGRRYPAGGPGEE